jgi:hypothetical protein
MPERVEGIAFFFVLDSRTSIGYNPILAQIPDYSTYAGWFLFVVDHNILRFSMQAAVILLTFICYGAAIYLWWRSHTPIFFFTLLAGHLGSAMTPLWTLLYGKTYDAEMHPLYTLASFTVYQPIMISYAWVYTLPALAVLFLYQSRRWLSSYLMSLVTFGVFLLYHLLIELSGLSLGIWSYSNVTVLPFGIENWMLSIVMAALISLALLYVLLLIFRFSWTSMLVMLIPAPLLLSVLVRGLLGAPSWISLMLEVQTWAASIGVISTLALIAWAVHIVSSGLSRVDREIQV